MFEEGRTVVGAAADGDDGAFDCEAVAGSFGRDIDGDARAGCEADDEEDEEDEERKAEELA